MGTVNFQNAPEGSLTPFFPFGPMMMHAKMPSSMVKSLNKYTNKTIKDEEKIKKLDHSDKLVGKLKQEFLIEEKELNRHMDFFNTVIGNFVQTELSRHFTRLADSTGISLNYKAAWIVRQFAGEFNPVHIHTSCDLSCVGYLKLPEKINEEWEEDYKDHHPCKGHIEFIHGSSGKMHQHRSLIRPTVGDFFLFPADLMHTVYPFYCDGERRSFSMNIKIDQQKINEKGEAESLDNPREHGYSISSGWKLDWMVPTKKL